MSNLKKLKFLHGGLIMGKNESNETKPLNDVKRIKCYNYLLY
jgi:hypothetical protein